jgi:hypothetical protein
MPEGDKEITHIKSSTGKDWTRRSWVKDTLGVTASIQILKSLSMLANKQEKFDDTYRSKHRAYLHLIQQLFLKYWISRIPYYYMITLLYMG